MKRSISLALAIAGALFLAAAASAGDHHNQDGQQGNKRKKRWQGQGGGIAEIISQAKKHHHHHDNEQEPMQEPIPLDPGLGDGQEPTDPVPPTREGYVWVNGHWERAKAGSRVTNSVQPLSGDVIVRDHRKPKSIFPEGATVRDHRTVTGTTSSTGKPGRGQRFPRPPVSAGNGNGGVTVTTTNPSAPPRNKDKVITGTGFPFDIFDVGEVPPNRDHRTKPVVRDHRTKPVVRDHR